MGLFDFPITTHVETPGDTDPVQLFEAASASFVFIDVTNVDGEDPVGVTVSVVSTNGTARKVPGTVLQPADAITRLGPFYLVAGDEVIVETDTADGAEFSLDGLMSTE